MNYIVHIRRVFTTTDHKIPFRDGQLHIDTTSSRISKNVFIQSHQRHWMHTYTDIKSYTPLLYTVRAPFKINVATNDLQLNICSGRLASAPLASLFALTTTTLFFSILSFFLSSFLCLFYVSVLLTLIEATEFPMYIYTHWCICRVQFAPNTIHHEQIPNRQCCPVPWWSSLRSNNIDIHIYNICLNHLDCSESSLRNKTTKFKVPLPSRVKSCSI